MTTMRLNVRELAPQAYAAVANVEAYIQRCGLEHLLIELVKMRASQPVERLAIGMCAQHAADEARCG